jgi:KipI family sensor histidine kinase inhibitor
MLDRAPRRPAAVTSIVVAYDSLAVRYDPAAAEDAADVRAWMANALAGPAAAADGRQPRQHIIPVVYGGDHGPDLAGVASQTGRTPDEVVALHSGAVFTVAFNGFAAGFPYLSGTPEALCVARLATPRARVAAGSVAIAGGQASIYPCESPAGWRILGRTNIRLFDVGNPASPARLAPGDRVRFQPVDALAFDETPADVARLDHDAGDGGGGIEVVSPGALTTVQDSGRPWHEAAGVSPGGAAIPDGLAAANVLLGNHPDAAALEVCVTGPSLRFTRAARVVLVGADGGTRGVRLHHGRAVDIAAGDVLEVGPLVGAMRAVLALRGGISVRRILGSCATDVRAGFGGHAGRALRAGDILHCGRAAVSPAPPTVFGTGVAGPGTHSIVIRMIAGPQDDWFGEAGVARFEGAVYEVTARQDRMGVHLHGPALTLSAAREMRSQPVATGSIQIPPDGRPMVLLSERQTHGGYPQIGCVIGADLGRLASALPGTRVSFARVSLDEAWRATGESRRALGLLAARFLCPG